MRFEEALKAMRQGKEVFRYIDAYGNKTTFSIIAGKLKRHYFRKDGSYLTYNSYIIGFTDILAEDWEIL